MVEIKTTRGVDVEPKLVLAVDKEFSLHSSKPLVWCGNKVGCRKQGYIKNKEAGE